MLTVLMVSHNGSRTLPVVLAAYRELLPVSGGWQMVFVDNGSTDSTREIVESYQSDLPLQYVREPRLGKSCALNTGLRHVTGDIIVLTDDDVIPRPEWLAELRAAADKHPEFSIFTGPVVASWETTPEHWILDCMSGWEGPTFAISDPSRAEGPIPASCVFGANMAIRAEVVKMGYRFNPDKGPVGRRYDMGEDTEFAERLERAGFKSWYCKRAVVAHIIRKYQMTEKWVLGRARYWGRLTYERETKFNMTAPRLLFGVPRYMIREILIQGGRVAQARLKCSRQSVLKERLLFNYLLGRALSGRTIHHKTRQSPQSHCTLP